MFSKATANFVRQIDPEGSLIHVSRLNDSRKLVPMALVVKRNRIWFWQRPKYQPTDFTLGDLLQGDTVLSPEVCETDFLTYEGTFGDKLLGKVDTKAVVVEGRGISKLQSCFGKLKKEELIVKKLLRDSSDRLVDMTHVLVKQVEKQAEVLAIVKERILTTNSCSISQTKKKQCTFQGVLGLLGMLGSSVKVCVNDSNNIERDSDVSLEIPSGTVIAYSILELEIKKSGHYEHVFSDICLQPGAIGGFEADSMSWSTHDSLNMVDGKCNGSQEMDLSPLAELSQLTQRAWFKKLQEIMRDRAALSDLQCDLEELCTVKTLDVAMQEEPLEDLIKSASTRPDRPSSDSHTECRQLASAAHLNATHLLVSAMEELPDETLSLLSESCADFLEALDTLMCRLKESESLPIQCLPIPLQDNQAFQLAEQLLSTINVALKRDTDRLWTETGDKAGALPVPLRLSIHGLSLLCNGVKG